MKQQQQQQQQQIPPQQHHPIQQEDPQKKIKIISKKLRQIEELKEKQTSGQTLDVAALDKIKTEPFLRNELQQLSLH